MNSTRQIPSPETASGRGSPPPVASTVAEPAARWPVLARIVEIHRGQDEPDAGSPSGRQAKYRVDAPHASVPGTSHAALSVEASTSAEGARHETSVSDTGSAPAESVSSQVAAGVSQMLQPYGPLLRFAAMVGLMAAGGASAMLMMGVRSKPVEKPPIPVTTSPDHTVSADAELHSAELKPVLEAVPADDTDTSSAEPTAKGPASQPVHDVAVTEVDINDADAVDKVADAPSVPAYPTTPYAAVTLPPSPSRPLPQVRTSEPEVALRGELLETHLR